MNSNRRNFTDTELVSCIMAGDIQAFEEIFRRYYPLMCTFAQKLLKDSQAARDFAQDTFIRCWIWRSKLDPQKSIKNLLYTMVRNRCLDYLRLRRPEICTLANMAGVEIRDNSSSEDMLNLRETAERIDDGVGLMPEQRQTVFRMSRYMHLSNQEIADSLNISVRTVEKHIQLALKSLKNNTSVS
jgi:RNA polymerase sigma-70 factor (family 1)